MSLDDVDRYRELFEVIDEGFCLCEIIVDEENRPVDYRFLETNPLFEEMTGLKNPVGKTAYELVPDLEDHWVKTYARAALGGERIRFEQGSAAMGRWFDVFTMPLSTPGQFGIVFKDRTAQRQAELDLRQSETRYRRLAERERRIAIRLQRALLPDAIADHPGIEIVSHYSAGDELLDVGGDWYDTIQWPNGATAIIVGDVVGHDLEAAAAMGGLRAATKALALSATPSASVVLEALHTCASGPEGVGFVTAFVVIVNSEATSVSYASAGHPPALLARRDGGVTWLNDAVRPPAGVARQGPFVERTIDLEPGSTIVLYSDGLVERRAISLHESIKKLERHLDDFVGCDAASFPRAVTRWLDENGPATDDVVVVRVARPA